MTKKKTASKIVAPQKTMLNKIAGQIGHLAGEIVVGKDHLMEKAGYAIDSLKETIHTIAVKTKTSPPETIDKNTKKAPSKPPKKNSIKQATKNAATKKVSSTKRVIKKNVKKAVKKK
jgi:hypothetical protein